MLRTILTLVIALLGGNVLYTQSIFEVEGNGIFTSPGPTNLDLLNENDLTNTWIKFGDNNTSRASFGYDGLSDIFKISLASTLSRNDLTISPNGKLGINTLASGHRMLISHNSTSGISGSSQMALVESGMNDFTRLQFDNEGFTDLFRFDVRPKINSARFHFFYSDGLDLANLMTLDGDNFYVGIHQENPESYLHIKQQFASLDALAIVNDDATGGDKWSMRIGDEDILIYFNDDLRGGFDVSTGNYNNFPPSIAPAPQEMTSSDLSAVNLIMQMSLYVVGEQEEASGDLVIDPLSLKEINPDLVENAESDESIIGINYSKLTPYIIQAIQERQDEIDRNKERIAHLKIKVMQHNQLLDLLENQIAGLTKY